MASECSTSHMTPHMYRFLFTRTGSHHSPWNSLVLYLGEIIAVQPVSTRRLALDFTSCYWLSPYHMHLTWSLEAARLVYILAFWNVDRDVSVALLPMCPSNFRAMGQFQTQILRLRDFTGSYDETSYRGLSDIETGPKPCHGGPWTVKASRRFRSVSFMNVVSGVSGRKYMYQLFNATIRHPTSQTYTYLWPIQLLIDGFCLRYAS